MSLNQQSVITIGDIFQSIRRRKWLFLSILVLSNLIGLVFVFYHPEPRYKFHRTLTPAQIPSSIAGADFSANEAYLTPVSTRVFLQNTIKQLDSSRLVKVSLSSTKARNTDVTLVVTAPLSQQAKVNASMQALLDAMNNYQAPLVTATRQLLVQQISYDQSYLTALSKISKAQVASNGEILPSPSDLLSYRADVKSSSKVTQDANLLNVLQGLADLQQKDLELKKVAIFKQQLDFEQALSVAKLKLSMIKPAAFSESLQRSASPEGMSALLKYMLCVLMGIAMGVFIILLLEFKKTELAVND